jgi:hypothetical protein
MLDFLGMMEAQFSENYYQNEMRRGELLREHAVYFLYVYLNMKFWILLQLEQYQL